MGKDSLLLQPIQVGNLTLKNRVMFPPLTTGYEERDGSIGPRSLAFYERLAKGGVGYIVIGDVAPVRTASPTPKLFDDAFWRFHAALNGFDRIAILRNGEVFIQNIEFGFNLHHRAPIVGHQGAKLILLQDHFCYIFNLL